MNNVLYNLAKREFPWLGRRITIPRPRYPNCGGGLPFARMQSFVCGKYHTRSYYSFNEFACQRILIIDYSNQNWDQAMHVFTTLRYYYVLVTDGLLGTYHGLQAIRLKFMTCKKCYGYAAVEILFSR